MPQIYGRYYLLIMTQKLQTFPLKSGCRKAQATTMGKSSCPTALGSKAYGEASAPGTTFPKNNHQTPRQCKALGLE